MKERIFRTVWELRKRGYADSTIQGYSRKLKTLSKLANLDNPESVRSVVAKKKWSNAFKEAVINAYDHYVKVNGFSWNKPLYRRQRGLPYVATTEQINKIISRASKKYALIFSILRDTGLRPIEIHNLTLENVDLEKGAVTVKSAKFGNPRVLKVQPSTLAMLKEHIQKLNPQLKQKLVPNSSAIRHSFARYRNIVAQKLHEPNLRKIARADPTWTGVFVAIPVGGVWVPINKTTLLAPWIGLASLVTVATASVVYAKRRKKQQN